MRRRGRAGWRSSGASSRRCGAHERRVAITYDITCTLSITAQLQNGRRQVTAKRDKG
jgi:hypothetical protein